MEQIQISRYFSFIMVLLALSGCGEKKIERNEASGGPGAKPPPGLVKIGGTVTIDGTPIPMVQVLICPPDEAQKAPAENRSFKHVGHEVFTDKDGKWRCSTFSYGDGLNPGEYLVVFRWLPQIDPENRDDREDLARALDVQETLPEIATKAPNYDPKMGAFYTKYRGNGPGMMKLVVEAGKPQTDLKWDLTTQ
ncbi:MAG: hypothetical protein U0903_20585 [Planctomycetales bacterium]